MANPITIIEDAARQAKAETLELAHYLNVILSAHEDGEAIFLTHALDHAFLAKARKHTDKFTKTF